MSGFFCIQLSGIARINSLSEIQCFYAGYSIANGQNTIRYPSSTIKVKTVAHKAFSLICFFLIKLARNKITFGEAPIKAINTKISTISLLGAFKLPLPSPMTVTKYKAIWPRITLILMRK